MYGTQGQYLELVRSSIVNSFLGFLLLSEIVTIDAERRKARMGVPIRIAIFLSICHVVILLIPEAFQLITHTVKLFLAEEMVLWSGDLSRKLDAISLLYLITMVIMWASSYKNPIINNVNGRVYFVSYRLHSIAFITSVASLSLICLSYLKTGLMSDIAHEVFWLVLMLTMLAIACYYMLFRGPFQSYDSYLVSRFRETEETGRYEVDEIKYTHGKIYSIFGMFCFVVPCFISAEWAHQYLLSWLLFGGGAMIIGQLFMYSAWHIVKSSS